MALLAKEPLEVIVKSNASNTESRSVVFQEEEVGLELISYALIYLETQAGDAGLISIGSASSTTKRLCFKQTTSDGY